MLYGCSQPQPLPLGTRPTGANPFARQSVQPTSSPVATSAGSNEPASTVTSVPTIIAPSETTLLPSATPQPTLVPSPTPAVQIIPATIGPTGNEQYWRAQQQQREVFTPPQLYEARTQTALLWFDPITGQVVEIGTLQGIFPAQAQFTFLPTKARALEVPYRINGDFGLTSISEALQERMRAAGYLQSVEAFIVINDTVVPKQ